MNNFPFRFTELMDKIRDAGIVVSPAHIVDIQKILFLSTEIDPHTLPFVISPIIATSPKEQDTIINICKNYFDNSVKVEISAPPEDPPQRQKPEFKQRVYQAVYHLKRYFQRNAWSQYVLAAMLLISVSFFLFSRTKTYFDSQKPAIYKSVDDATISVPVKFAITNINKYKNDTSYHAYWNFDDFDYGTDTALKVTDTITKRFSDSGQFYVNVRIYNHKATDSVLERLRPGLADHGVNARQRVRALISNLTGQYPQSFQDSVDAHRKAQQLLFRFLEADIVKGKLTAKDSLILQTWDIYEQILRETKKLSDSIIESREVTLRDSIIVGSINDKNINGAYIINNWAKRGFVFIVVGLVIAFCIFYNYYYKKNYRLKSISKNIQAANKYNTPPLRVTFPDVPAFVNDAENKVKKISIGLLSKAETPFSFINIGKSIIRTSKNAGVPSLVFENKLKIREFIAIIQCKGPNDHIFGLFENLVDELAALGIYIEKYTYFYSPYELFNFKGKPIKPTLLLQEKYDYNLFLFSNGIDFIDQRNMAIISPYSELFKKIERKVLITPLSFMDWGNAEVAFNQNDFLIVPATSEALITLAEQVFSLNSNGRRSKWSKFSIPSAKYIDFDSIAGIKSYLKDDNLFQIVCALAVYPRLSWPLTTQLCHSVVEYINSKNVGEKKMVLDYDVLLTLFKIDWLHTGTLKDKLRSLLLQHLKPDLQLHIRKTILELLQDIKAKTSEHAVANMELGAQIAINSFSLYSYDPVTYRHLKKDAEEFAKKWYNIGDWPFVDYIKNFRGPGLDGQKITVEDYVFSNRRKRIWMVSIVAIIIGCGMLFSFFNFNNSIIRILPTSMKHHRPIISPIVDTAKMDTSKMAADTTKKDTTKK